MRQTDDTSAPSGGHAAADGQPGRPDAGGQTTPGGTPMTADLTARSLGDLPPALRDYLALRALEDGACRFVIGPNDHRFPFPCSHGTEPASEDPSPEVVDALAGMAQRVDSLGLELLELLGLLPLAAPRTLARVLGQRDPAPVAGALATLESVGLAARRPVPSRAGGAVDGYYRRGPHAELLWATDAQPRQYSGQQWKDADLPAPGTVELAALVRSYELLEALLLGGPEGARLVGWETRYARPTWQVKPPGHGPVHATVDWGYRTGHYLLVPDLEDVAVEAYHEPLRSVVRVLGRRQPWYVGVREPDPIHPTVVVATADPARVGAWVALVRDMTYYRLPAFRRWLVADWASLPEAFAHLHAFYRVRGRRPMRPWRGFGRSLTGASGCAAVGHGDAPSCHNGGPGVTDEGWQEAVGC